MPIVSGTSLTTLLSFLRILERSSEDLNCLQNSQLFVQQFVCWLALIYFRNFCIWKCAFSSTRLPYPLILRICSCKLMSSHVINPTSVFCGGKTPRLTNMHLFCVIENSKRQAIHVIRSRFFCLWLSRFDRES